MAGSKVNLPTRQPAVETSQRPFADRTSTEYRAILGIRDQGQFVGAVVSAVVSMLHARAAFVFVPSPSGGPAQCIANRMSQGVRPQLVYSSAIRSVVDDVLKTRKPVRRSLPEEPGAIDYSFHCVPVPGEGGATMALGALVGPERSDSLRECDLLLSLIAEWFERRDQVTATAKLEAGFERTRTLLEIFHEAGETSDYLQAMTLLADELQRFVGCHQVAFGFESARQMKIAAISGAGKYDARGQTSTLLARAMQEAAGVGSPIAWPPGSQLGEALPAGNQEDLIRALDCRSTVTIPLKTSEGKAFGAWVCTWDDAVAKRDGATKQWELIEALEPHVSVVARLIHLSKPRGWRAKVAKSLQKTARWKKAAWAIGASAAMAAMFLPVDYRISADCRVQPNQARQIAAPFDGVLETTTVKPGQLVEEGQLLATLDDQELSWRLAESKAQRGTKLKLRDEAMARDDVTSAQLAQLDADSLALDIESLAWQIDHLEVRATIPGVLLSGDLDQSTGVPVAKGQKLFEIAPIEALEVEIAIPDAESPNVETDMSVEIRLESQPGITFESRIGSVHPISEMQDGENVFVCYASLENSDGELRPGMRGRAKIVGAKTTLGWRLFHKPIEFLRLHFWW